MSREQNVRERIYDLELTKMSQIDVSAVPVCVTSEFADADPVDKISLAFRADCYCCVAADVAEATTNVADKAKRRECSDGDNVEYYRVGAAPLVWAVSKGGGAVAVAIDKEVYRSV